ncbi:CHAT domain-containing protein [Roseomonas sp. BN140053]|uniref:CHAT domain-containing protein n=1 Tax=Roseomonas sp. BN140053 TaxID=3391898 RepID=UPI0039E86A33
MRPILAPLLLLAAAGCVSPPPSAYVGGSAGGTPTAEAIGRDAAGEECRMVRSGSGADILCGAWDSPSARVREVSPAQPAAALAEQLRAGVSDRLTCGAPAATTILGSQPAALLDCRRVAGGWPAFVLAANAGGRAWQADGVLPSLPAAERAVGVLSGLATADAALPRSAALELLAGRLSREAFGSNDVAQYEALMTVGRDSNQAERFATAETAYRAALAVQERQLGAGSPETFAPLVRLALQVSNQGRFPEAEGLFNRAAALAPRAADPLATAVLLHHRGLHEANRGRTEQALATLAQAEAAYTAALPPGAAGGGVARARLASAGPSSGALAPLGGGGLALDALESRAVVGVVEARRNRAAILRAAGRSAEAEAAARDASRLAAAVPGVVETDSMAARLARTGGAAAAAAAGTGSAGEGDFARSAARFARGLPRSRPYADTLLLQAQSLAAGGASPSRVMALCRDAVAVLRELREGTTPQRIAPCVDAFAADGADQALLAEAIEAAQLAQGGVTTTQIARAAARLGQSRGNPAVADAIREREAAQAELGELFRQRDAAAGTAPPGRAPAALAEIDARIAAAQGRATEADAAAQAAAPGYAQLVQSVASTRDVLAALAPGEALAVITLPPNGRGWTFVLSDGRIAAARLGADAATIASLVTRIRAGVESGDSAKPFDAEAAFQLHSALFAGVAAPVAAAKSLIVVPAGPLLSIPFGLLVEAAPPQPRSHEGASFLLARLPVAHVPAPSSFVELRRTAPSRAPRPWFGFGDPRPVPANVAARTFPADPACGRLLSTLPALQTAAVELTAAGQLLGANPAERRTGPAFTANAVAQVPLRDYRILHFATHGILPSELSCLSDPTILTSAPGNAPDASGALLSSSGVLDLNLDADLVILSACNTGGGAAGGESLSSLARAFFYAGARALVVTHWYVNDVAATRIVAFTLRNLNSGQPLAEALRAAQLDLARNVPGASHPALWAPFALVGPGPRPGTAPGGTT